MCNRVLVSTIVDELHSVLTVLSHNPIRELGKSLNKQLELTKVIVNLLHSSSCRIYGDKVRHLQFMPLIYEIAWFSLRW